MTTTQIIEKDSNYTCTIVQNFELKPATGFDNLKMVTIFGYNCLVSKDTDPNEQHLFFPAETKIDSKFLSANNLFRKSELNEDKEKKGFFEPSGRVKAIKMRGIVSSGFLIPVTALENTLKKKVDIPTGTEFHIVDYSFKLCEKYRRPEAPVKYTRQERRKKEVEKFDIVIPNQFRLHEDTRHFLRFLSEFEDGDLVTITEKLHGTSAVLSNVLVRREFTLKDKIAKFLGVEVNDKQYYNLYSSRTVIKNKEIKGNESLGGGFYGTDLWGFWAKKLKDKIEKGLTLYGEIVGYTDTGAEIQKGYHYGCEKGQSEFYVYRITYTTPDGNVIEFNHEQIIQYCQEKEIKVVPFIKSFLYKKTEDSRDFADDIMYYANDIEVMCPMNNFEVPREGVVIRRDNKPFYGAYKWKSQLFLTHETKMLDQNVTDTEEEQKI